MALFVVVIVTWAGCAGPSNAEETIYEHVSISGIVDEAAGRFGLPPAWIYAVIKAESGGDPRALSPKGAMGLMQLMPTTWRALSARYRLGPDPFDRRANVQAGAAYLRQMFDQFGPNGFIAAYNAGPGRYADVLAGRRALPAETVSYVTKVERSISSKSAAIPVPTSVKPVDWRDAGLFARAAQDPDGTIAGGMFVQAQSGVRP